jgi:hypothetical protein
MKEQVVAFMLTWITGLALILALWPLYKKWIGIK